jgi:hypothetical protein
MAQYLVDLRTGGGVQRGVNFDLIVATDFYDGPEEGFVFYSSGEGLRFSVVAESRFPIFRAFGFALLDGNWSEMVGDIIETSPRRVSGGVLVFSNDSHHGVSELFAAASAARERAYYVGVGNAYLKNIAVTAVANEDWRGLATSNYGDYREKYYAIHRKIKTVEARGAS